MNWGCITSHIISFLIIFIIYFFEKKRKVTPWDYKDILYFFLIFTIYFTITIPLLKTIISESPLRYLILPALCLVLLITFILYDSKEKKLRNLRDLYLVINNRKDIYWGLGIGMIFVFFRVITIMIEKTNIINNYRMIKPPEFNFSILILLYFVIMEEIIFRVVLIESFKERMKIKSAVIVSSIIFSLYHCPSSFILVVKYMIIGIIFGFLFIKRKTIITTIIAHAIMNLSLFISF